jgi:hypothetical protein
MCKVVDLEETRHKTRADINSLEREIEETELSLGYHRSERRRGIPDAALGDNAAKSYHEHDAKRQMTVRNICLLTFAISPSLLLFPSLTPSFSHSLLHLISLPTH